MIKSETKNQKNNFFLFVYMPVNQPFPREKGNKTNKTVRSV